MPPNVRSRRFGRSIPKAFVVAAVLLAASLSPRIAVAGCTEDAAGMCERPIACTPPQGGRCTTVAIPQPLTGHKFECRCLVPPPPPPPKNASAIGGMNGGATAVGAPRSRAGQCQQQCNANQAICSEHAPNPAQRSMCQQQFQRCEQSCQGMH